MKVLLASLLLFAANKRTGAAARLSQHEMPQGRLQRSSKQRRNEFFSYRAPFASESNPPTQKPPTTKPASHPPSRSSAPDKKEQKKLMGGFHLSTDMHRTDPGGSRTTDGIPGRFFFQRIFGWFTYQHLPHCSGLQADLLSTCT